MAVMQSFVLVSAVILVLLVNEGYGLKCFICNSQTDTGCSTENVPERLIANCAPNNNLSAKGATACRKIVQDIDYSLSDSKGADRRVIRTCAYDEDDSYKDKCYRRSGFGSQQTVCSCSAGDSCNGSSSLTSTILLLPVVIFTGYCVSFLRK